MFIPQAEKKVIGSLIPVPVLFFITALLTLGPGLIWVIRDEVTWFTAFAGYFLGIAFSLKVSAVRRVYPFGILFQGNDVTILRNTKGMCRFLEQRKYAGYTGAAVLAIIVLAIFYVNTPDDQMLFRFDAGMLSIIVYALLGFWGGYTIFIMCIYISYFMRCFRSEDQGVRFK